MLKGIRFFGSFTGTLILFAVSVLPAADRITVLEGKGKNVSGTILAVNAEKITIDVRGEKQEIPANIIALTEYDGEPSGLKAARTAFDGSRMPETLEVLAKIDPKTLTKPEMKQDFNYFTVAAKAKSVLAGSGDLADAEKSLLDFIKNNKNSYHYFEICELYGDLMVQAGKFDDAKKSYAALAKAPWPEYSLKATVSLGMAEITEKKTDSARKNFETVIKSEDNSEQAERLKNTAQIGLALCLASEKKYEEAIKMLEEIAKNSGNEDSAFQSLVYNSLGSAYAQAVRPRQAILAYMHTDILFSSARNEHIKALQELSKLWKQLQRNERAEETDNRLKSIYNIGK
ncbi:MAG: tetratricopeptide repeat protein [Planctomycetaceae bacterium]|jgi:predicted negative regulator of RcsB-dependent stress response|nr:tetratricopeptide repeat protein [Planctomycetaceae bacterium]